MQNSTKLIIILTLFNIGTAHTMEHTTLPEIAELYYVTSNPVKYQEGVGFFKGHLPHVALHQCDIDVQEIQTLDQTAIAIDKARQAWQSLQKPVLVDDTSVYFDAYPNFPGTMTRFVYQTLGLKGIFKLAVTGERMNIRIVLVLMYGENQYITIDETIYGTINTTHRVDLHNSAAPFDTIFIPDGCTETVDELRLAGKAEPFLYRIRALKRLATYFNQEKQNNIKMRKFVQNKLWRDKAAEILEAHGSIIHSQELDECQFDLALCLKLIEEAHEAKDAKTKTEFMGEIADIYEVIDTLCALRNVQKEEIIEIQTQKRETRGGFITRTYVTIAEHPEGSFGEKYCLADPQKYKEVID